jgi:hypothetical protein
MGLSPEQTLSLTFPEYKALLAGWNEAHSGKKELPEEKLDEMTRRFLHKKALRDATNHRS